MMVDKASLTWQVRVVLDATPDLRTVTERGIRDQVAANNPSLDIGANKALIKETIKEVFLQVLEDRSRAASQVGLNPAGGDCTGAIGAQAVAASAQAHEEEEEEEDDEDQGGSDDGEVDGRSSDSELEHATNRDRARKKKMKRADGSPSSSGGGGGGGGQRKPASRRRRKTAGKEAGGRKREPNPNNPFNAPLPLSEPLAALVGARELSRPQIVKAIWAYIKDKGLQDANDKRYIVCDARLSSLFNTDRVHMFTMNKLISKHVGKDGGKHVKVDDDGRQDAKEGDDRQYLKNEAPSSPPPPPVLST